MIDEIFGKLEHDGYAYIGKTIINAFGSECEASLQINAEEGDDIIAEQYEAYKYFVEKWDSIQMDILNKILAYYNCNAIQLSIISVVFCHREPLFFMPRNFKNITKNS